jgi:hypothetical protein
VTDDPIPESLLRSHPELAIIADALDAHRRGDPVRGTCPECGAAIQVTDVDAVHVTVVACANGHTLYRAKRSADRAPILVSAADAAARGLARVTVRCDASAAGMYARPFPMENVLVALNGPPGGPLVVMVWDCTALGAVDVETAVRARLVDAAARPLEIIGADHGRVFDVEQSGLVFRTGSGRMRIVWFAFLAQRAGGTVMVGLGTSGYQDPPGDAAMILANAALSAAVRTLSVE